MLPSEHFQPFLKQSDKTVQVRQSLQQLLKTGYESLQEQIRRVADC
jgi:hypothetical protein